MSISRLTDSPQPEHGPSNRWWILSLVALAYFVLVQHRSLLFYVQEPLSEELSLSNLSVCTGRAESLAHDAKLRESFDAVVSKAVAKLNVLAELNMPLDLSHTSDPSFDEAVQSFEGPIFASHNNCRTLVPQQRQFANDQLQTIIDRDGVIGTVFDCWMLKPDWTRRDGNNGVTLATVADHIDHVCQLAGSSLHAAIGGDTDGQGGRDGAPHGIDTVADYQKVGDVLAKRGYADEDVANVMHRNWQRFFERWLPTR